MALNNLDSEIFWAPTKKHGAGWICYKDSPTPPPLPDPKATADAQTASNLATAQKNAELNRVNQYTPWGSLTYTQNPTPDTFDQAGYDAAMQKYRSGLNSPQQPQYLSEAVGGGDGGDRPAQLNPQYQTSQFTEPNRNDFIKKGDSGTWNSTVTLSPEQQKLLDSSNQISQSMADLGQQQIGAVRDSINKNLDFSKLNSIKNNPLQTGVSTNGMPSYVSNVVGGDIQNKLNLSNVPSLVGGDALLKSMEDAQGAAYKQQAAYLDPQWNQEQHDLENKLTQQGVMQNSDAWNRAIDDFGRRKAFAYNQATQSAIGLGNAAQNQLFGQGLASNQNAFGQALQSGNFTNSAQQQKFAQDLQNAQLQNSIRQGLFAEGMNNAGLNNSASNQAFNQSLAERNQNINELMQQQQNPINVLNALRTGSQVTTPQFSNSPQVNLAGTDIAGLTNNAYNQAMGQYNAKQASNNALTSGLFSLGGSAMMAPAGTFAALSDIRTKENIKRVGFTDSGVPIYTYNYIGNKTPLMGVMAQELEKVMPEAVITNDSGFKMVKYGMI